MPRTGRPKGIESPLRDVVCVECSGIFQTRHSQGRYCSDECRRKGHRAGWDKYAAKREKKPEQIAAHLEVNKAIKRGDLIPQPCEKCGKTPTDAHHPDYSKPLSVEWLCRSHHRAVHGRNKT
jgi:hypothetical protein